MDDVRGLLVRNAELQTELRLVKEQLSQANSANSYLLQRLSTTNIDRQSCEHELTLRENAQLRNLLNLTRSDQRVGLKSIRSRAAARDSEKRPRSGRKSVSYKPFQSSETSESEEDLIDIDNDLESTDSASDIPIIPIDKSPHLIDLHPDDDDVAKLHNPAHFVPFRGASASADLQFHVPTQPRHHWSVGTNLERQNGNVARGPAQEADPEPNEPPQATDGRLNSSGFNLVHQDGTVVRTGEVNTTAPSFSRPTGPWNFPRRPLPFSGAEHRRLGGMAWLLEEYDEKKKAETWAGLSRSFGVRPDREYEVYYEEVIRPEYLEKEQKKREVDGAMPSQHAEQSFASTTEAATASEANEGNTRAQREDFDIQSNDASGACAAVASAAVADTPSLHSTLGSIKEAEVVCETPLPMPENAEEIGEESRNLLKASSHDAEEHPQSDTVSLVKDGPHESVDRSGDGSSRQQPQQLPPAPSAPTASLDSGLQAPLVAWRSFASVEDEHQMQLQPIANEPDATKRSPQPTAGEKESQSQLLQSMHADPNFSVANSVEPAAPVTQFRRAQASETSLPQRRHINFEKLRQIPNDANARGPSMGHQPPPFRPHGELRSSFDRRAHSRSGSPFTRPSDLATSPLHVSQLFARSNDPRTHRTVLITNIPPNITLFEVLEKVKGGKIVAATYVETAGMRTKPYMETDSALIVFFAGRDAANFVHHSKDEEFIFFYSEKWEAPFKATAKLLDTPSRPLLPALQMKILQEGLTRVVFVHGETSGLSPQLVMDRIVKADPSIKQPLKMGYDKDGIMFFEFAAMIEAEAAWNAMGTAFSGLSRGFLRDPCDRPLNRAPGARPTVQEQDVHSEVSSDAEELEFETSKAGVPVEECKYRNDPSNDRDQAGEPAR